MLANLKEITFASADPEEMEAGALKIIEETLGRPLARADPARLLLKSLLAIIIQQRLLIDETAKQNLLAYAKDDNLDHIGILVGCKRISATAATATFELKLSAARENVTVIPAGTRITAGDKVYFSLNTDVIFLAGETIKTSGATCTETGENGNGYIAGEIDKIVDPQPFLESAINITKSEGGADIESDDAFRVRIQEAPESFSVAGSKGAYIYFTKKASSLITDVAAWSPSDGVVDIRPLLKNGELPSEELIALIYNSLNANTNRPLTDKVIVQSPNLIEYEIDYLYCISRDDATNAAAIQAAAEQTAKDYELWQRSRLGRDLNPTELYYRLRKVGVKRAEIISPTFKKVDDISIAKATKINAVFAGLEDE